MNCGIGLVENIFIVTSGKGGVGKSTIACRLAMGLANQGLKVGLLDLDLCGPSIPRIIGLCDANVQQCSEGWLPVVADKVAKNVFVMSIAFLVSDKDSAVAWRGPRKDAMIDQFLSKVCWGHLDVLVIDTPPGTSDEHISVVEKIRRYAIDRLRGAIIVSTPQRVAICDIRRQLTFCSKVGIPVVGLIENMSGFECPNCKESIYLFASGGVEALAKERGVYFLGRLPLDCQITRISDQSGTFEEKSQLALQADSPILVYILPKYFGAERTTS
ncbi:cytosolic Fe S cluster assembly factor NUBP2 [Echinococcus multilocularis]|uniref:Cytosolic Fe S cluster assembly factor NUBP2 n=1 Tax=Echinococcus multilocularis TaxID=6211 RepID=A0A087VYT4_ECHMU|nr:cytosolic Fe S cluster assembly factor NUBP2 [Echinococcus multilocularis]